VCLLLDPRVAGSNPADASDLKGYKNPLRTFIRMGIKTRVIRFYGMKNQLQV
jgi:hypothetical protein